MQDTQVGSLVTRDGRVCGSLRTGARLARRRRDRGGRLRLRRSRRDRRTKPKDASSVSRRRPTARRDVPARRHHRRPLLRDRSAILATRGSSRHRRCRTGVYVRADAHRRGHLRQSCSRASPPRHADRFADANPSEPRSWSLAARTAADPHAAPRPPNWSATRAVSPIRCRVRESGGAAHRRHRQRGGARDAVRGQRLGRASLRATLPTRSAEEPRQGP